MDEEDFGPGRGRRRGVGGRTRLTGERSARARHVRSAGLGVSAQAGGSLSSRNTRAEPTEHANVRALLDALPIDENACYANIRAKIRRKYPISRAESDMSSGADKFAQLIFRRLSPDRPASSFTTQFRPDGFQGRVVHPNEARVCTPAEALSCLGFEVSSLPHAKLSVGHRLAGNAFSPLVTKAIFDAICTPLKDR